MCIIVAKPAGISMPSNEILRTCFDFNPDGSGFMIAEDDYFVHIEKGFMTFDEFIAALENHDDLGRKSVVMHFRIATHGKISKDCCHPFPITSSLDDLRKSESTVDIGVAHNGIIRCMTEFADEKTSDTMAYISRIVNPLYENSIDFMYDEETFDAIEKTVGSKLCFLDSFGEIRTVGKFIEDDGVLYSNDSYIPYEKLSWYDDFFYISDEEYDELVKKLPYDCCLDCEFCEECAATYPYCATEIGAEAMAEESKYFF